MICILSTASRGRCRLARRRGDRRRPPGTPAATVERLEFEWPASSCGRHSHRHPGSLVFHRRGGARAGVLARRGSGDAPTGAVPDSPPAHDRHCFLGPSTIKRSPMRPLNAIAVLSSSRGGAAARIDVSAVTHAIRTARPQVAPALQTVVPGRVARPVGIDAARGLDKALRSHALRRNRRLFLSADSFVRHRRDPAHVDGARALLALRSSVFG